MLLRHTKILTSDDWNTLAALLDTFANGDGQSVIEGLIKSTISRACLSLGFADCRDDVF
jgi:hypothetical protein